MLLSNRVKAFVRSKGERKFRVATSLCSEQKEVGVVAKSSIDIVAGQESWENEDARLSVEGFKWFGKPHSNQNSQRGEDGVGFLVCECLVNEVEFITSVRHDENVWMKVRRGRGRSALYIGCVYMPNDSTSVAVVDSCYDRLKEDVLCFREKETVVLLWDFHARVGI